MPRARIREEAAAWVVRLSDAYDAGDWAAFEAWRATSVEHEIAYEREALAWERLDRAAALRAPQVSRPIARPAMARRFAAIAATALIALGGGGALVYGVTPGQAYATAVGEQRLVRLADGSTIELNTNSKVIVRYRHGRRSVELVRGEALFHVTRGGRPFAIRTACGRIETPGADLSVRAEGDRAEVTVERGAATVDDATLGANTVAVLTDARASIHTISPDEVERQLAWQRGEIALNGQTLAAAAAEFNRYNRQQITIDDPRTGALRVGGYFRTADVDGFVAAITRTFPAVVSARTGGEIRLAGKS